MHELPWIMIFGHEWGDLPMIFKSDEVTSENHWQIASWVTKIIIHSDECIIIFLICYFMSWTHNSTKNIHRLLILPLSPMITRLIWTIWTPMSSVPKKADKLNLSLSLSIVISPQLICDVIQMRGTGIVTSYSSIVLACTIWHKGNLH